MSRAACPVCGDPLDGPNVATCQVCGRDFHLIMRTDVDGKDCGHVWIHEERLYLEFACRGCLEASAGTANAAARPPERAAAARRRRYRRRR